LTFPYWYPGTYAEYLSNGTTVDPRNVSYNGISIDLYYNWQGYVTADEY